MRQRCVSCLRSWNCREEMIRIWSWGTNFVRLTNRPLSKRLTLSWPWRIWETRGQPNLPWNFNDSWRTIPWMICWSECFYGAFPSQSWRRSRAASPGILRWSQQQQTRRGLQQRLRQVNRRKRFSAVSASTPARGGRRGGRQRGPQHRGSKFSGGQTTTVTSTPLCTFHRKFRDAARWCAPACSRWGEDRPRNGQTARVFQVEEALDGEDEQVGTDPGNA